MPKKTKRNRRQGNSSSRPRRRSLRSTECQLQILAQILHRIHQQNNQTKTIDRKRILIFTGAGLSVNSGIQPFRGKNGLWSETLWTNATRSSFRKDPLSWYNDFWLHHFPSSNYDTLSYRPNAAHEAISKLCNAFSNMYVITQNVDGLHCQTDTRWNWNDRLVECHGRLGLFKCLPNEDSDTSEDETDSSEEEEKASSRNVKGSRQCYAGSDDSHGVTETYKRVVKLGSMRKRREWKKRYEKTKGKTRRRRYPCQYEMLESIPPTLIEPLETRRMFYSNDNIVQESQCQSSPPSTPVIVDNHSDELSESIRTTRKTSASLQNPKRKGDKFELKFQEMSSTKTKSSLSAQNMNEQIAIVSRTGSEEEEEDDKDNRDSYKERSSKRKRPDSKKIETQSNTMRRQTIQQKEQKRKELKIAPKCPSCSRPILPQVLLFDEGYHSHTHYQFQKMEEWISQSSILIFIGTSFAVNITEVALEYARNHGIKVWNFNIEGGDFLEGRGRLDCENILGDVVETLPALWKACHDKEVKLD